MPSVISGVLLCFPFSLPKSTKNNVLEDGHYSVLKQNNALMYCWRQELPWAWMERWQEDAAADSEGALCLSWRLWLLQTQKVSAQEPAATFSAHTEQSLSSLGQCMQCTCVYVLVEYNNGSPIPEHECVLRRRVCLHILWRGGKKLWLISNSVLKEKLFQIHFFITVFVKVELLRRD